MFSANAQTAVTHVTWWGGEAVMGIIYFLSYNGNIWVLKQLSV